MGESKSINLNIETGGQGETTKLILEGREYEIELLQVSDLGGGQTQAEIRVDSQSEIIDREQTKRIGDLEIRVDWIAEGGRGVPGGVVQSWNVRLTISTLVKILKNKIDIDRHRLVYHKGNNIISSLHFANLFQNFGNFNMDSVSDGSGGAIIALYSRFSNANLIIKFIDKDGNLRFEKIIPSQDIRSVSLASDSKGGAFISWISFNGIFINHINSEGVLKFEKNLEFNINIDFPASQISDIESDSDGNRLAILLNARDNNNVWKLAIIFVNLDGTISKPFLITELRESNFDQLSVTISQNGAIVIWYEINWRLGENNLKSAFVDNNGNIRDYSGGIFFNAGTGEQNRLFIRGDIDSNNRIELSDAIRILNWLFQGGQEPSCLDAADSDDNGKVELTDAVRILSFLFSGGQPPAVPYPDPGIDETDDNLSCG